MARVKCYGKMEDNTLVNFLKGICKEKEFKQKKDLPFREILSKTKNLKAI